MADEHDDIEAPNVEPTALDIIRARADEHDDEIQSVKWYTVAELASRWKLSETTVRLIPPEELKYKEFGRGDHKKRRRYRGDWVQAYEEATGIAA